jgi:hypothetical protein
MTTDPGLRARARRLSRRAEPLLRRPPLGDEPFAKNRSLSRGREDGISNPRMTAWQQERQSPLASACASLPGAPP